MAKRKVEAEDSESIRFCFVHGTTGRFPRYSLETYAEGGEEGYSLTIEVSSSADGLLERDYASLGGGVGGDDLNKVRERIRELHNSYVGKLDELYREGRGRIGSLPNDFFSRD